MQRLVRSALVGAAGLALAVTAITPAEAASTPRADKSAGWLSGQLTGGLIYNDQYSFYDYGLSVDTALGLAEIGGQGSTVAGIAEAVADGVNSYITGEDFGDTGSTYAGQTAKTLVLAQTAKDDPTAFGGVDLVGTLESTVSTSAPTKGRIGDISPVLASDYANVIGQSYAARGLAKAGSAQAGSTLRFLLAQQCSAGFFRLNFTADKTAADQTCDGGKRHTTSAPDTDVTALAVINLKAMHSDKRTVKRAIADATAWLKKRQKANGSYGGGRMTEASNANSTGLAAWALAETGNCRAAVPAAKWVGKLQVRRVSKTSPLAGEAGAIGYDAKALAKAERNGIRTKTQDQWRRTTSQAAPALKALTMTSCRKF